MRSKQKAKPILIPLIRGEPVHLGQEEQKTVAAWITKTAMVAEYAHPPDVSSSRAQRRHLRRYREPPYGWYISISRYQGEKWRTALLRKSAAIGIVRGEVVVTERKAGDPVNTQSITMGIGELVIQILATSLSILSFGAPPQFEPYAPRIWPFSKAFAWPPAHILNDADVRVLSNGLSRMLRRDIDHFDPDFFD